VWVFFFCCGGGGGGAPNKVMIVVIVSNSFRPNGQISWTVRSSQRATMLGSGMTGQCCGCTQCSMGSHDVGLRYKHKTRVQLINSASSVSYAWKSICCELQFVSVHSLKQCLASYQFTTFAGNTGTETWCCICRADALQDIFCDML